MFDELKAKLEELVSGVEAAKAAAASVETATSIDAYKPVVEALIAALEASGYTVTRPEVAPEAPAA